MKIKCSSSIADPYLFEGASRHHVHHFNLLFANNKVQFFILRSKSGGIQGNVFLPTLFLFYRRMFVNNSHKHIFPLVPLFVNIRDHTNTAPVFLLYSKQEIVLVEVLDLYFSNSSMIHKESTKRKLMFNGCLEIRFKTAHFCILDFPW